MRIKKLNEAHYGGAFDIEDDQFFTREDINEFASNICTALTNKFGYQYDPLAVYMETPNKLYISIVDNNYIEAEYTLSIDMRRIRTQYDLYNRYGNKVVNEFAKLFNVEYQEANLDESLINETIKPTLTGEQRGRLMKAVTTGRYTEVASVLSQIAVENDSEHRANKNTAQNNKTNSNQLTQSNQSTQSNQQNNQAGNNITENYDWLAPRNLSDNEYKKLIKQRRPGYKFDNINKGKNPSQRLFRELDRIIRQDNERAAMRELRQTKEEPHTLMNDPKYNFDDPDRPNNYIVENNRCFLNKNRLNESLDLDDLEPGDIDFDNEYVYMCYGDVPIEVGNSSMSWDYSLDRPVEVGESHTEYIKYIYKTPRDWFEEYLLDIDEDYTNDHYDDSDLRLSINKFKDKIFDHYRFYAEDDAYNYYIYHEYSE